jgi:hypothetical protein
MIPAVFGTESQAASSRLRRAEIGIHHHIAGAYLLRYAQESSWREDNRRVSNGDQVNRVAALAMKRGKSVDFTGYWQRHLADRVLRDGPNVILAKPDQEAGILFGRMFICALAVCAALVTLEYLVVVDGDQFIQFFAKIGHRHRLITDRL